MELIDALRAQRRFWTDPEFRANVIELMRTQDAKVAEYLAKPECALCKRRVSEPCNTRDHYFQYGPWDGLCRMIIFPGDYE